MSAIVWANWLQTFSLLFRWLQIRDVENQQGAHWRIIKMEKVDWIVKKEREIFLISQFFSSLTLYVASSGCFTSNIMERLDSPLLFWYASCTKKRKSLISEHYWTFFCLHRYFLTHEHAIGMLLLHLVASCLFTVVVLHFHKSVDSIKINRNTNHLQAVTIKKLLNVNLCFKLLLNNLMRFSDEYSYISSHYNNNNDNI